MNTTGVAGHLLRILAHEGSVKRPVWLFSLDTEQFAAVPMTTGRLKAYFQQFGRTAPQTQVDIVHFFEESDVLAWCDKEWSGKSKWRWRRAEASPFERASAALKYGVRPVAAFSVYTWNAEVFLEAIRVMRARCPELLIVVGGPHVQRARDFLFDDGIDVVVLGEGEATFQELLDCESPADYRRVKGLAFLDEHGALVETEPRERFRDLDLLPSALDVIPLTDESGEPLYSRVAYETSRGCPFKCAFCEWGTGAIGTKMFQHSIARIRSDFERLVAGGVNDIWLCDSNFGALAEDLEKARILVELRERTGKPATFGTSWSKSHNRRVQEIVLLLMKHEMLQQYVLALQTLTPLALELSNRKNMKNNHYEPIVKDMVERGVPVSAELIWGLPGDNLADFERNLDKLNSVFPNINIYGFTLLPGTEFFEKRNVYEIQTIPVAGYGKAKGEYVVGCHTFSREEGIEGYFLVSAHNVLTRGHVMPLTARYLSLLGGIPVASLLRRTLRALADGLGARLGSVDLADGMTLYESRIDLYLLMLSEPEHLFDTARRVLIEHLSALEVDSQILERALKVLQIDAACCPRGGAQQLVQTFSFDALSVWNTLTGMGLPPPQAFSATTQRVRFEHPGGAGTILKDPDGGSWFQGRPSLVRTTLQMASQSL
jgi:tRNA A37 methylthiotransferase MiaB